VTDGTFADTATGGVFTFQSFAVSTSSIPANVGATYTEGSQPIQTMSWDGTQPTQFTRDNGGQTNGSNFFRTDFSYFYGLSVATAALIQGDTNRLVEAPLTVTPLSDAKAPLLSSLTSVLLVVLLAFAGASRVRWRSASR
jgi:hypothetical protein